MKYLFKIVFLSLIIILNSYSESVKNPKKDFKSLSSQCETNSILVSNTVAGQTLTECIPCPNDQKPNKDKTKCICKDSKFTFVSVVSAQGIIGKCVPKK